MATPKTNTPVQTSSSNVHPELKAQREYARRIIQSDGFEFSVVVAEAFVRGIRDIGYKSTGTALDELVDNAIQASARKIHIVFGYGEQSDRRPDRIAVLDDGHGMDPVMIRLAAVWGGTHRVDDRTSFGKYGYGLPSACVSQGQRFVIYSAPADGELHKLTFDIDELGQKKYHNQEGRVMMPEPEPAELPLWITEYLEQHDDWDAPPPGTAIVIEKLDRLDWVTTQNLERHLLEHFGIVYRNYLRQVTIFVNGTEVQPVDPLFTTDGYRFYDLDEDRAEPLPPIRIEVKDREERKALGDIKVRFSFLPPTFASKDKTKGASGRNANARLGIMRDHNGIIVLRAGRQIDVVTRCDWTTFQNNDRYWKVEVDFPPSLDEEFSITTSKQQVVLSERMWEILKQGGVERAITKLRGDYKEARAKLERRSDTEPGQPRPSEQVMKDSEKFKTDAPAGDPVDREMQAQKRLDEEASRRAAEREMPLEQAKRELVAEVEGRPYRVYEFSSSGGPFFRVEQVGGQRQLSLNTAHRFYTDVYAGPDSTPRLRAALELLLFVIGECELDAADDRAIFYKAERQAWSTRFDVVLDLLNRVSNVEDRKASEEAMNASDAEQPSERVVALGVQSG